MKRLAAVALVTAVSSGVALAGLGRHGGLQRPLVLRGAAATSPLLGLAVDRGQRHVWLARLNPKTLKPRPAQRLALDSYPGSWSYSPDRTLLAFGNQTGNGLNCCPARVRLVDIRTLRPVRAVSLGVTGQVVYLSWSAPDRLLALVRSSEDPGDEGPPLVTDRVMVVDPATGGVLASNELEGRAVAVTTGDHALVLVLEGDGYGPVRLGLYGEDGRLVSVTLDQIEAGARELPGDIEREDQPAVAVDRTGGHAYVVAPAGNLVADVDLATLAVGYHVPSQPVSLVGRLHDWLEPRAQAKGPQEGSWRSAVWLGNGQLAVYGRDGLTYSTEDGLQIRNRPSGLVVIDTGGWTAKVVDPLSSALVVANGALLSWGWAWDSGTQHATGAGLGIYDSAGLQRFRVFGRRMVFDVQVVGPRAFVGTKNLYPRYAVVSLRTGQRLRLIRGGELPLVLSGAGSVFFD
jgi:hypothetical protein